MPVVPRAQRQVELRPIHGGRKQAAETFASQGGQLARAQEEQGLAFADAGARVGRFGLAQYAAIQEQARQEADETAVLGVSNGFDAFSARAMTAALDTHGQDALAVPEKVRGEFEKVSGELEAKLTTPRQRQVFARLKAQKWSSMDLELQRHVSRESEAYQRTEAEGFVDNRVNDAVRNFQDPIVLKQNLDAAVDAVAHHGKKLGLGAEGIAARQATVKSTVHVGAINALIATGRDREARSYFDGAKGEIAASQQAALIDRLDTASTEGEGLRAATEVWGQLGPKAETDPIEFDKMDDAARERFNDDPKAYKATMQFLRERKASVDAARADRKEAVAGALWSAVAEGATLAQIQAMPEYQHAPGQVQTQVKEHVLNAVEAAANRAYTRGQRARAQQALADNETERKNWAGYWESSNPATLARMTDNQILALTPRIGIDHVNRLMTQHRSLVKSEEAVRDATIDADLFNRVADTAGLSPYAEKKSEDEKTRLGTLKAAVEDAIDHEQRRAGKPLPREQKEALMQRIVGQRVMIDDWGSDTQRIAAVVNAGEQANAYVPIGSIPPRNLAEAINYLRSTTPAYQRLTDAQIQARAQRAIERAYAADLLKLGREEALRRLQGGQ